MRHKNPTEALNDTIAALERRQLVQLGMIKQQFYTIYNEFRPPNIADEVIAEDNSVPEKGRKLMNNAIGVAAGFFARKLIMGSPTTPVKKLIGRLMQSAVANVVAEKHADTIKATGSTLMKRIMKYRKKLAR